ncbi:VWA domain-containing protein, partial [bacterium]|nr:VWA domain-containing protein [bacterium]
MRFENPTLLYLLFLWPVLAVIGVNALAWRERAAARLGDASVLSRLYSPSARRWRRRRMLLLLIATGLLMIAAARPQYGRIEQTVKGAGTNVIIAIDVSPSMKARDVLPDRITRAKTSLQMLLNRLAGQRVGIVVFSGTAILQCPMTLDQAMVRLVLDS